MNKKKIKIIISWILVLVWMLVIFYYSNMNHIKSNDKSKNTINYIIETTEKIENNNSIKTNKQQIIEYLNYPIRKCAHITIYLVLSILIISAIKNTKSIKHPSIITLIICFIYAITDEYHQTFIDGRTGQFIDVLIDTTGSMLGLTIYNKITQKNTKRDKK